MPTGTEKKRDKELHDRDVLFRRWRKWHREQIDTALAGAHGVELGELLDFLARMDLNSGDALINLVRSQGWSAAPVDLRYLILREVDQEVARVREEGGLPPFDDALPWSSETPTVFSVIKQFLLDGDAPAAALPSDPNSGEE